ncbi:hypothetical protein DV096_05970 [Bradymonadaceae bacterium TMQ3]|nr:hypothetical protein DV096_05970 [Bradymonadaceae bacterium TMQ3]TXC76862.1 hypothetical protein FRC91_09085 [Bradymonadales bacterium TMQ1]
MSEGERVWTRLYPAMVSVLGGVGLGLAVTYLVGAWLSALPGWELWAEFFRPKAMGLMLVPYVFLLAHLLLRVHVGHFLLGRGEVEAAERYASRRGKPSILRSRREAANQRGVWARALVRQGRYSQAREVLLGGIRFAPSYYEAELRRWLIEVALRQGDHEAVLEQFAQLGEDLGKGHRQAALRACRAELALRQGDMKGYEEEMTRSLWADPGHPRAGLTRTLAMVEFAGKAAERSDALAMLVLVEGRVGDEIPARRSELAALRAWLLAAEGREEEARQALEESLSGPQDSWSKQVIESVRAEIATLESA